jgi:hypothetical protein
MSRDTTRLPRRWSHPTRGGASFLLLADDLLPAFLISRQATTTRGRGRDTCTGGRGTSRIHHEGRARLLLLHHLSLIMEWGGGGFTLALASRSGGEGGMGSKSKDDGLYCNQEGSSPEG